MTPRGTRSLHSRADVARWLGAPPASFAYPYGVPGVDFTARTQSLVAEAGFAQAVANAPGRATQTSDVYALPRRVVPDCDGEQLARWLSSAIAPAGAQV